MSKKHLFTLSGLLALTTIVSGTILSSTITHADDNVVDTVEVTVIPPALFLLVSALLLASLLLLMVKATILIPPP